MKLREKRIKPTNYEKMDKSSRRYVKSEQKPQKYKKIK